MSSSAPRGGERMIHQDFIARIRYSNALPPPPNPPKLLDIPNTGLASGQYTNPGFASRLAREQPLNIEADAELGMPLDLVGMPGVFDGDESSIQAPAQAPPVHPHDRPLLRPLSTLGRPKVAESSVSFLRRTEYISNLATKRIEAGAPRALLGKPTRKRAAPEPAGDSPAAIKRKIDRSFEVAEQSRKNISDIRHPSNRDLRVVDAFQLLPDLDGLPDSGAYVTIKFANYPVPKTSTYDTRLLSGLFKPIEKTESEERAYEEALKLHERDPQSYSKPQNLMNYNLYLPQSSSAGESFRARFDVDNPDRDDEDLYTHQSDTGRCFQFARLRAYETTKEVELDHKSKWDEELVLSFSGGETDERQKAVYYYPVMQRSFVQPQRTKNIQRNIGYTDEEEQVVDQLDVAVDDPTDDIAEAMAANKEHPYGVPDEPEPEAETNGDREGGKEARSTQRSRTPSDRDAEGDEED